jgi:uncharacterized membrane protein
MRFGNLLSILLLIPAICRASPWDSHSFGGRHAEGLFYWVVSLIVMFVMLCIHLMAKGSSVEKKHDPNATAHKVRNATRVLAMTATCVSVFCWVSVLGEFDGQTVLVYTVVYVLVFVFYARGNAKRHAQHLPEEDNNKTTDENHEL